MHACAPNSSSSALCALSLHGRARHCTQTTRLSGYKTSSSDCTIRCVDYFERLLNVQRIENWRAQSAETGVMPADLASMKTNEQVLKQQLEKKNRKRQQAEVEEDLDGVPLEQPPDDDDIDGEKMDEEDDDVDGVPGERHF